MYVSSSTAQYNLSAPQNKLLQSSLWPEDAAYKTVQRFFLRVNKYYSGLLIICETICCVYKLCLL